MWILYHRKFQHRCVASRNLKLCEFFFLIFLPKNNYIHIVCFFFFGFKTFNRFKLYPVIIVLYILFVVAVVVVGISIIWVIIKDLKKRELYQCKRPLECSLFSSLESLDDVKILKIPSTTYSACLQCLDAIKIANIQSNTVES